MDLRVGCIDITPVQAAHLCGFTNPIGPSTHVESQLEANFLLFPAFDRPGVVALLAIDSLFASRALRDALLRRLSPHGVVELVAVASHTHSAPALDPTKPVLGQFDTRYFNRVVRRVEDAIVRSLETQAEPISQWRQGIAHCPLNVSRRRVALLLERGSWRYKKRVARSPNRRSPIRHELDCLVACDRDGSPIAMIWSWACHPVNVADGRAVSADFPGLVRDHVRGALRHDQLPVLYLPGFAGDIRADFRSWRNSSPRWAPPIPNFAPSTPERLTLLSRGISAALQGAIRDAAPIMTAGSVVVSSRSVGIEQLIDGLDGVSLPPLEITVLRSGEFYLLCLGAEVCDPYHGLLVDLLPPGAVVTGYANQVFGYLPVDSQIASGGYEAEGFFESFSLPGRFKARVQDRVRDAVAAVVVDSP